MVYSIVKNHLFFNTVDTGEEKTVVFPIEQPIFSVYHRPVENLILISLFDTKHHLNNRPYNVFAVNDRTGEIVWRINADEKTQFLPFQYQPLHKYMYFAESNADGKVCVYDEYYQTKWEINLETGCIERFVSKSGFK